MSLDEAMAESEAAYVDHHVEPDPNTGNSAAERLRVQADVGALLLDPDGEGFVALDLE